MGLEVAELQKWVKQSRLEMREDYLFDLKGTEEEIREDLDPDND